MVLSWYGLYGYYLLQYLYGKKKGKREEGGGITRYGRTMFTYEFTVYVSLLGDLSNDSSSISSFPHPSLSKNLILANSRLLHTRKTPTRKVPKESRSFSCNLFSKGY